jgi:hypothetical protein
MMTTVLGQRERERDSRDTNHPNITRMSSVSLRYILMSVRQRMAAQTQSEILPVE